MVQGQQQSGISFRFARNVIPKLDAMLKEAKIDGELMSSLEVVSKNFESAAKVLLNC
jgi:hypothetical protein